MNFIEQLAVIMADRQELRLDAKKVKDDLVLTIVADRKGTGKVYHITIPKEDIVPGIDDKIFMEIRTKANEEPAKFQSSVTDGPEKDDDSEENVPEGSEKGRARAKAAKKKAAKAAPKKGVKKMAPVAKKAKAKVEKKSNQLTIDDNVQKRGGKKKTTPAAISEPAVVNEPEITEPVISEEEKAEQIKQGQFDGCMSYGREFMEAKEFEKAVEKFKSATEIYPESEIAKSELELATKKHEAFKLLNS